MKHLTKYWLLSLAILFLILKIVTILWSTIDMAIAARELPIRIRNTCSIEILILVISIFGLLKRKLFGFTLSMLYSFVAIEYAIIYKLIISQDRIGNAITTMTIGVVILILILLNQRKDKNLNTKSIRKGVVYSILISLPFMLFLSYGHLLVR